MSDEISIETDPGWTEDVTFNVNTCNSDVQKYIDSRKDDRPSDNRSISSQIERCQSEDGNCKIQKQQNENKYVELLQENMSDVGNRLNGQALQGTEQEEQNNIEISGTCTDVLQLVPCKIEL